jgi:hypothetical protein
LLALVALGLAALAGVGVYFDAVVGAVIRNGASEALGVEATVGWARLGLLDGEVRTGRLRIANPAGFETPYFMRLSSGRVGVTPGSLGQDVIEVSLLRLDGVEVYLETADRRTNYAVILGHLDAFKRRLKAAAGSTAGTSERGSVELIIREIQIRDIRAFVDSGSIAGPADRVPFEIPELILRDVGTSGSGGASVAEVSDTVVRAVLIGVAKRAPENLVRGLLASVGTLGPVMLEVPGARGAASVVEKLGDGTGKALKKMGGLFKRE